MSIPVFPRNDGWIQSDQTHCMTPFFCEKSYMDGFHEHPPSDSFCDFEAKRAFHEQPVREIVKKGDFTNSKAEANNYMPDLPRSPQRVLVQ